MTLDRNQWIGIGLLSGLALLWKRDEERIKINDELVYKFERTWRGAWPLFYIAYHPSSFNKARLEYDGLIGRDDEGPAATLEEGIRRRKRGGRRFDDTFPPTGGANIFSIINPDGITVKQVKMIFPQWNGDYETWNCTTGGVDLKDRFRNIPFNYFNAESFEAEDCNHDWAVSREEISIWEATNPPALLADATLSCVKCGKTASTDYSWIVEEEWMNYDAESFEAEDSRRQLKKLMKGMSKAKKKRISKMVQLRGIENTLAELLANAEVFAAPASFGEPEDNDTYHNLDETDWRNRDSCEICARPFRLNKFGMNLIQHYLKESNHGIKGWKTKENPEGTRRTARNITGFFLHEYRLDALNQYILFQEKTKISDKVIELLRLSIVERIIAGDVVNLIEMMDMQDEIDDTPIFGEGFERDFEAESFNKL